MSFLDHLQELYEKDPNLAFKLIEEEYKVLGKYFPFLSLSDHPRIDPGVKKRIFNLLFNLGAHQHKPFWYSLREYIHQHPEPSKDLHKLFLEGFKQGAHKYWYFWRSLNKYIRHHPEPSKDLLLNLFNLGAHKYDNFWRSLDSYIRHHPEPSKNMFKRIFERSGVPEQIAEKFLNVFSQAFPEEKSDIVRKMDILFPLLSAKHPKVQEEVFFLLRKAEKNPGILVTLDPLKLPPFLRFYLILSGEIASGERRGERTQNLTRALAFLRDQVERGIPFEEAEEYIKLLHHRIKGLKDIHVEQLFPALGQLTSAILTRYPKERVLRSPILRDFLRKYGKKEAIVAPVSVNFRELVTSLQEKSVLTGEDRDFLHNYAGFNEEDVKRGEEIIKKTLGTPEGKLLEILHRYLHYPHDSVTEKAAEAVVVYLNTVAGKPEMQKFSEAIYKFFKGEKLGKEEKETIKPFLREPSKPKSMHRLIQELLNNEVKEIHILDHLHDSSKVADEIKRKVHTGKLTRGVIDKATKLLVLEGFLDPQEYNRLLETGELFDPKVLKELESKVRLKGEYYSGRHFALDLLSDIARRFYEREGNWERARKALRELSKGLKRIPEKREISIGLLRSMR